MNTVALPGLDGRLPLGFLATIGLLHLLDSHQPDARARLSWDPATCTPRLHTTSWTTAEDVVDWLTQLAVSLPTDQLLPGFPPGFPPPGPAPDRLRADPADFAALRAGLPEQAQELLGALVTDLATDHKGRVHHSLMLAPTGKQSFHTMLGNQHRYIRAEPARLREALLGWRRVRDCRAESFDHAALIGSADDVSGKAGERAVPGATWLAIAGLPAYRLAADSRGQASVTAWRRIGRRRTLVWPLWTPHLPLAAVKVLLEHPATSQSAVVEGDEMTVDGAALKPLGVFRLCAARRLPTSKSGGPLAPMRVNLRS
ncbi:hypothetical protein JOF53_006543 [Crossiella equi]|uniref:Uncharacterized protein n=1 Tax=Crossiella equi TaxID=130796 RepID=A0ABS5AM83_9PSEU|nr:hypothetical protein [Crossiella equi]MBP2477671.1 hypothetical protein [Crossiella equi]